MKEKNKRKEETVRIVKVKKNRGGGEGKEGYQGKQKQTEEKREGGDFLGGLMVRTSGFHCPGSISGQRTEIPQATRCDQKEGQWGEKSEGSRDEGVLSTEPVLFYPLFILNK